MGFFENLLKKEARKLVSDIVDKAVDNVAGNVTNTVKEKTGFGKSDNVYDRIKQVVATEFSDCELRENVSATEMGAEAGAASYTYGIYRNGAPVIMINVFVDRNAYSLKRYRLAKEAAEYNRVAHLNFFSHLPNEVSYITERLRENM